MCMCMCMCMSPRVLRALYVAPYRAPELRARVEVDLLYNENRKFIAIDQKKIAPDLKTRDTRLPIKPMG